MDQCEASEIAFSDKEGQAFQGVTRSAYENLWKRLLADYGISITQVVEAAAMSMAMVSRYALGLSARGGKVLALVDDTPAGWVALATMRHLCNGGSDTAVLTLLNQGAVSDQFSLQAQALVALQTPIEQFSSISGDQFQFLLESCHNIICGLYSRTVCPSPGTHSLVNALNEARIPVHCIEAPLGIDVDSGTATGDALFASSTLSLGLPFVGLLAGSDYVGRHYLADISFPREFYRFASDQTLSLFAEQPVIQIFSGSDSPALDLDLEALTKSTQPQER